MSETVKIYGSAADGYIYGTNAAYATARTVGSAMTTTSENIYIANIYIDDEGPQYSVYRGFFIFHRA